MKAEMYGMSEIFNVSVYCRDMKSFAIIDVTVCEDFNWVWFQKKALILNSKKFLLNKILYAFKGKCFPQNSHSITSFFYIFDQSITKLYLEHLIKASCNTKTIHKTGCWQTFYRFYLITFWLMVDYIKEIY